MSAREHAAGDPSIYRQVLQDRFEALAPELRAFHDVRGLMRFGGQCRIEAPQGAMAKLLGWAAGLPPASDVTEFEFELQATTAGETWTRRFPGRVMRSTMRVVAGRLVERIGLVDFWFSLNVAGRDLEMVLARVTVLGMPLPRALMPQVWGRERAGEGLLHFDAGARLPVLGLLTAYKGFLSVTSRMPAGKQGASSQCASS